MEMQKALEHFRDVADKRLGNVKEGRADIQRGLDA